MGVLDRLPVMLGGSKWSCRSIVPLSLATFRRHVDFWRARGWDAERSEAARFGYEDTLRTQATCMQAGGYWLPLAFGWITPVYPDETQVWGGQEMSMVQAEPLPVRR